MAEHNGCASKDDVQDLRDRVRTLEEHAVRRTELSTLLERVDRIEERSGQTLQAVHEVRADLRAFVATEKGRELARKEARKLDLGTDSDPRQKLLLVLGAIAVAAAAGGGGSELIQALIRLIGGAP